MCSARSTQCGCECGMPRRRPRRTFHRTHCLRTCHTRQLVRRYCQCGPVHVTQASELELSLLDHPVLACCSPAAAKERAQSRASPRMKGQTLNSVLALVLLRSSSGSRLGRSDSPLVRLGILPLLSLHWVWTWSAVGLCLSRLTASCWRLHHLAVDTRHHCSLLGAHLAAASQVQFQQGCTSGLGLVCCRWPQHRPPADAICMDPIPLGRRRSQPAAAALRPLACYDLSLHDAGSPMPDASPWLS